MKLFDVVGALVVATWLVVGGLYIYRVESSEPVRAKGLSDELVMEEGENWLILQRDNKDVGFVHQTRTQLTDGWLLEYDMLMTIQLLGSTQPIDTSVKSRLDEDGYLEEFNAKITASGRHFEATGEVDGKTLHTTINLTGEPQTRTIHLEESPRLSASAFNQLLASGDLKAGQKYKERFFDPTTMQMTDMVLNYKGEEQIDVYGESHHAHHIVQQVAGNTLDVYVDDHGEILIQEFPLKMVGARVPEELGRTRASAIRRKLAERQKKRAEDGGQDFQFNLDTAMKMIGGQKPAPGASASDTPDAGPPDAGEPDPIRPDAGFQDATSQPSPSGTTE